MNATYLRPEQAAERTRIMASPISSLARVAPGTEYVDLTITFQWEAPVLVAGHSTTDNVESSAPTTALTPIVRVHLRKR